LKPSNVMVCKVAQQYDFVKVLDFGLAKSVIGHDVTRLTVEGVAAGTPGYIAPEVALGETAIDHRADLYALGCVGYFLLTGGVVFPDSNPVSMALKHVQAPPEPPSTRTELPIPFELERVIMQCLEKKPGDRPATARDVHDLLRSCCHAREDGGWSDSDAEAWWERHLPASSSLRSFAQAAGRTPPVVQKA
jgi:serine/threonine-protein kinase